MVSAIRVLAIAVLASLVLVLAPGHSSAESSTQRDTYNEDAPEVNLKRGTLRFDQNRVLFRGKVANLSRRHTSMCGKFVRNDQGTVTACTRWKDGTTRATAHYSDAAGTTRVPARLIRSRWNFQQDTITITVRGIPEIRVRKAHLSLFTLPPGAMHGNPFGDAIYARLARG